MLAREVSLRLRTLLVIVGIAVVAGALLMPPGTDSYATPREVRGTITQVSADAATFRFEPEDGAAASYGAHAALRWEDSEGRVQAGGRPECVRPGGPPRKAAVSFVDVGGKGDSEPVPVRIRCLG
jgi:hypothetical protein